MLRRIRANNDAGHLPIHDASSEANTQEAHHNGLKRKVERLEQRSNNITNIYGILQQASEHGANELLQHIRQDMSPDNVPAFTGELLSRRSPSPNQTNRNILPPTSTSTEFEYELTILHNLCYPASEPMELPEIDLDRLVETNWSKSTRSIDDRDFANMDSMLGDLKTVLPFQLDATSQTALPGSPSNLSLVTNPSPPLQLCDSRLKLLNINYWTRVPISNEFAAGAISTYLETDHGLLGFFDADLLLSDLVEQHLNYCSPFLVSSLLCMACVSEAH